MTPPSGPLPGHAVAGRLLSVLGAGTVLLGLIPAALAEPGPDPFAPANSGPVPASPALPSPGPESLAPVLPSPGLDPLQPSPPAAQAPTAPVPENALPPGAPPPLELELTGNRQSYDNQLRRYVSSGHVMARLAGGRLMADRIEFDTETRTLYAYGSVRFQRGQQYMQASQLRYSLVEGSGEMRDVYGILDLDSSEQDLNLETTPSVPIPPPEPVSCAPAVPPPPQWHPHPWSVTAWGGQMFHSDFGQTFTFQGVFRPEYLLGVGLQRRLLQYGPFALELDFNAFNHWASPQKGSKYVGPFSSSEVVNLSTPRQSFAEFTAGVMLRTWLRPWLSMGFEEGISYNTSISAYEDTYRKRSSRLLNYLAFELEALVTPQWSAVGRIHHRSGAFGIYNSVTEGSNAYLLGLRYRYGQSPTALAPAAMPPPQGCPGALPPGGEPPEGLAQQLEVVTMGPGRTTAPAAPPTRPGGTGSSSAQAQPASGNTWARARAQEKERREAIARIDQRIESIEFQQSLTAERRFGFADENRVTSAVNQYGQLRPEQLRDLNTKENKQLVQGTISRWRFQARRLRITPNTLEGDRVGFTNDPFTPAQSWMDSRNVVARLMPNGDTVIKADGNRLWLEDRLPIPVTRETRIKKEERVNNRWVLGFDKDNRDGFFVGYNVPIRIGEKGLLTLQPQFMAQRAWTDKTDVYPLPGQPVGSPNVQQTPGTGDLFGVEARLVAPLAGFDVELNLDMSTFNPDNIADGTRIWGNLRRPVMLPLLGNSKLNIYGAYRFQVWNGSLGDQDINSAFGVSLENSGVLPTWGKLSSYYFWRAGVGIFESSPSNNADLLSLVRANAIGSLNLSLPLWIGKPAALTSTQAYANSVRPIVPGLTLNANILGTLAYFGDGTNQNTISLTGGPTLTLGHFVKPFLDYTQITVTGGGTLRQGLSPLSFDRAVDLSTLGIGLTQQIVGPLLFNGGIGLNVDPTSEFYGDITDSFVELRWQRRAYEVGVYYSPYKGLGGVRVKLNDFNFKGTGVPFVPYQPRGSALDLPF